MRVRVVRQRARHGGGHGGRDLWRDENGEYALTEALSMQQLHRGGGGGCGIAMG